MRSRSWTSLLKPLVLCLFLFACNSVHDHLQWYLHPKPSTPPPAVPAPSPVPATPTETVAAAAAVVYVEPEPPYPTDPKKPVMYLIQMEGNRPIRDMGGADVICITWKKQMDGCDYLPNSSWTQGRNFMWKKVTTMAKKYAYYVFMDEDLVVSDLARFEKYLLNYLPPVGVPGGITQLYPQEAPKWAGKEAIIADSYDAAFDAFHYDVVHGSLLLPYGDLFDHFSWWVPQLFTIYFSQIFFPKEVVGFINITANNPEHRNYPRGWNISGTDQWFFKHVMPDPKLRTTLKGYSWTGSGIAYPKPPKQRYRISDAFVTLADSGTVYWDRIAEIRNSKDGMPPLPNDMPELTGRDMSKIMFGYNK